MLRKEWDKAFDEDFLFKGEEFISSTNGRFSQSEHAPFLPKLLERWCNLKDLVFETEAKTFLKLANATEKKFNATEKNLKLCELADSLDGMNRLTRFLLG